VQRLVALLAVAFQQVASTFFAMKLYHILNILRITTIVGTHANLARLASAIFEDAFLGASATAPTVCDIFRFSRADKCFAAFPAKVQQRFADAM
jgi:hypothetical protein